MIQVLDSIKPAGVNSNRGGRILKGGKKESKQVKIHAQKTTKL